MIRVIAILMLVGGCIQQPSAGDAGDPDAGRYPYSDADPAYCELRLERAEIKLACAIHCGRRVDCGESIVFRDCLDKCDRFVLESIPDAGGSPCP